MLDGKQGIILTLLRFGQFNCLVGQIMKACFKKKENGFVKIEKARL